MIKKIDAAISKIEKTLIVTLTLVGLAFAFFQVVLRYVFNTGIHWLEAGLVTALIWAMLLGAVRAVREGLHPRVDLVPQLVSPKIRAILNGFAVLFTLILISFFIWDSIFYARFLNLINAVHPELGVGQIYPFLIVPIITILMAVRYVILVIALWKHPDAMHPEETFRQKMNNGEQTGANIQ